MNRSRALASVACLAALTLTACGGGDDDDASDTTTAETTAAPESTAVSETTEVTDTTEATETTDATETTVASETTDATETTEPASTSAGEPTGPGTQLTFGDAAVVAFDDEAPDALVEMVVNPLRVGTPEELTELQVPDTVGGETLYYLDLEITNVSAPATGGDYDPNTSFQLGLMQTDGEPAVPIINFVAFEPCDEEMPSDLAVGDTYETCLTFMAAPGQTVDSVIFAADLSTEPITWR
jgi:hypothetical protein